MKVKNIGGWFRGMFDELTNYLWSLSTKNTGQQVSIDMQKYTWLARSKKMRSCGHSTQHLLHGRTDLITNAPCHDRALIEWEFGCQCRPFKVIDGCLCMHTQSTSSGTARNSQLHLRCLPLARLVAGLVSALARLHGGSLACPP